MSDKTYRERRMAKADRLDEWNGPDHVAAMPFDKKGQ